MRKYIFVILLLSFQPVGAYASGEVYSLYSYIYNDQGYIVNIGIDTVSVFLETNVSAPISSIQIAHDPRTCDLDTDAGIIYVGCGVGKKVLRYSFPDLDYIDELQMAYEVWELEVIEEKDLLIVATSEWPDTSQGWFNIWEAPVLAGWITSYDLTSMNELNTLNTPTIPDALVYSSSSEKLYAGFSEIILTGYDDGSIVGEGRGIGVINVDNLSFTDQNITPDQGYNLSLGPAGLLYSPSFIESYEFYEFSIDGVGLIEYELDAQGNIVDHRLIDVGVKETSEVIYNSLYNEVYINHFGEDPDFVIYDVDTEEYELIEFTDKIWIHFCLSTDGQKLFFAAPDTNEILTYDLS